jgi:hypothetical protein
MELDIDEGTTRHKSQGSMLWACELGEMGNYRKRHAGRERGVIWRGYVVEGKRVKVGSL